MAGTTTNNGWDYPTSTDYVKDGATAIQTLATDIDTSTGKGLIAWQSWAPTLSGGWLNGNGTWAAEYAQLGKTVFVRGDFTVGSTTTKGTGLTISLPVTARSGSITTASVAPASATVGGSNTQILFGYIGTTTTFTLFAMNAAGTYLTRTNVTATVPATWATSDEINFAFTYEAA
jgi:hypothetical protein